MILDEIHRLPGIFQTLRGLIDQRKRKGKRTGQFLLLGSASIDLLQQSAETLAGRIAYMELTPFLDNEVIGLVPDVRSALWVRGGFQNSFLAETESESFEWRTAFIQTYLDRDVPSLGPRIPTKTLHRFWQMLAHNQGQMLNAAQLAAGLGISSQTVARYLDVMVNLLLVRRLQPWSANVGKRLVRSPRIYVRDSGLPHTLLGIRDQETLLGHPVVGASWEGMLIENILSMVPTSPPAWFYRTAVGAVIDLVLEVKPNQRWAIEIKRSLGDPKPRKGFFIGCEDIGAIKQIVLYPGDETFKLDAKTEVMPLRTLLSKILPELTA
ncbi:ATP-binding protein [Acidicapsa ligni]|uniref:ATP-binding protein n=1 Tax=Acidicapsa ligni TaxID=542300 RepID=UPI0021DF818C|nr:ATP-binding protein [Acidicapsa ligni]